MVAAPRAIKVQCRPMGLRFRLHDVSTRRDGATSCPMSGERRPPCLGGDAGLHDSCDSFRSCNRKNFDRMDRMDGMLAKIRIGPKPVRAEFQGFSGSFGTEFQMKRDRINRIFQNSKTDEARIEQICWAAVETISWVGDLGWSAQAPIAHHSEVLQKLQRLVHPPSPRYGATTRLRQGYDAARDGRDVGRSPLSPLSHVKLYRNSIPEIER